MNSKSWLLVIAAVGLATGCATAPEPVKPAQGKAVSRTFEGEDLAGFNPLQFAKPDRFRVNIFVDGDELLTLDQEPVRRSNTDTSDVKLVWLLEQDPAGSLVKYVFPDDAAIRMVQTSGSTTPTACGKESPKKFVCKYTRNGPATWKYTVRVTNMVTGIPLTILDPSMIQK
ncbi:MAG: hypothetical protein ABI607_13520 [Betaproteobacteria bacterium]